MLCSSAARAVQTAELVLPALGAEVTLEVERDLYTADADDVIERLRGVEEEVTSIMVVGHNPTFAELVLLLVAPTAISGRGRLQGFPTCALAQIAVRADTWMDLRAASGHLERLFVPDR